MADTKHASYGGYSPDMDGPTHEKTYTGFVTFVEIGTAVVICIVLALAIGAIRHAWLTTIVGVALAMVAGTVAAMSPRVGYRAPVAVAVLLLVLLAVY